MNDYRYPVSHEVANFIDYGSRLLERLKTEGSELSYTELRILSKQLGKSVPRSNS